VKVIGVVEVWDYRGYDLALIKIRRLIVISFRG
jgi:hypothetical protein